MGSSPTSGNSEDLSQYDPGCWTGRKTPTFDFAEYFSQFCAGLVQFSLNKVLQMLLKDNWFNILLKQGWIQSVVDKDLNDKIFHKFSI